MRAAPPRPLLLAVAMLSAAALGYEVLVIRLLSVMQWAPLVAMGLSLALLGSAAGATALSLVRLSTETAFGTAFTLNGILFGLACVAGPRFSQELVRGTGDWLPDVAGWAQLLVVATLLALPLFFAGVAVALALQRYCAHVGRVYGVTLIGAGLAGVAVSGALFVLSPGKAVCAIAGLAAVAAWLGLLGIGPPPRWLLTISTSASLLLVAAIARVDLEPEPNAYKALPRLLGVIGAREITRRVGPIGVLQVVETPQVPLRHAPGLSLASRATVPDQLAVFTDGDPMTVINRFDGEPGSVAYLDDLPSALPYHLLPPRPMVLILGAGGGSGVLQALAHEAARVDAVEVNPQLTALVRDVFGVFAGHLYDDPRVALHFADARGFVKGADDRWGLIQLELADGPDSSVGGLPGMERRFLYTVEALVDYLNHLQPGGMVAITSPVQLPPRDSVKVFATALAALERVGVRDAGRRLASIRNWQVSTLLIKNGTFEADEIERIRRFARRRAFDESYLFDSKTAPGKAHTGMGRPGFPAVAHLLLGPLRGEFLRTYPYRVDPATDERPYFSDFFRWSLLREAWRQKGAGGPALRDLEYPVLVATLIQTLVLGVALLLTSLGVLRRERTGNGTDGRLVRTATYFALIGLGFVMTQIVYMEKFMLYLSHPLYAVPVVVAGFLVFAGTGSRLAERIPRRSARGRAVLAVAGFVAISLLYWRVSAALLGSTLSLPIALKLMLVLGMIAPLAVCMGFLFPLGVMRLSYEGTGLVPWAFGVNRCAVAIAPVLTTLFAMQFGQSAVLLLAAACYGIAATAMP